MGDGAGAPRRLCRRAGVSGPARAGGAGLRRGWRPSGGSQHDGIRRVSRTVDAQGALVASAEHGLADVQVSLAAEVARTYFELRGAQRQLAVALRNAENQRRTVGLTEDRLTGGRGTAFDTERA